jgi:hypothetical protein
LLSNVSSAQEKLPDTDIYLVPLTQSDSGLVLGGPRLVTVNHPGFDGQPSFTYDSQYMYYSSERDDYKTDIYAVYIQQFQNVEFISTGSVSEFMPQQKPDMTGLSLIQTDAASRQVWFYGTDGSSKCLTPKLKNTGVYAWFNDSLLAVRLDGESANALCMLNIKTNRVDTLVKNIGPSIGKVPSENSVYYSVEDRGIQRLQRFNYDTGTSDSLLYLPGGTTEFTVSVDGSLWAANQGVIYRWKRAAENWDNVQDFGSGTLGGAYRVAVSRDMRWLAVVAEMRKY